MSNIYGGVRSRSLSGQSQVLAASLLLVQGAFAQQVLAAEAEELEVIESATPDMTEGGVGGTTFASRIIIRCDVSRTRPTGSATSWACASEYEKD